MKDFIDIYNAYKKISSPNYILRLEFSSLKRAQRIILGFLIGSYFIFPVFYFYLTFSGIVNTRGILFNLCFLFYIILACIMIAIKERYHRIAFKEIYQLYEKEMRFSKI